MSIFDIKKIAGKLPAGKRRTGIMIAVDGGSGSGKTKLAEEWKAYDDSVSIIGLDDLHIPVPDSVLDKRTPLDNFNTAFDIKYITDKILKPLRAGKAARFKILNPEAANAGKIRIVKPHGIVIVEGVYSLRPQWKEFFDFRIWIKMDERRRLQSMKKRGANTTGQMKCWQKTEKWYIKTFKPETLADLTVSGRSCR